MFKVNYKYEEHHSGESNYLDNSAYLNVNSGTILKAKFRFKGEYAPKNKEIVKGRAYPVKNNCTGGFGNLDTFLMFAQGLKIKEGEGSIMYRIGSESSHQHVLSGHIEIPFFKRDIGFDLTLKSDSSNIPLDELINLKELDEFVLTGNVPDRIIGIPDVNSTLLG